MGLPPLGGGEYLWDAFRKSGMVSVSAMAGEIPLTWQDVFYFSKSTSAVSDEWELQTLIDMSVEYCRYKKEGEDPFCIPPVERENGAE